MDNKEEEQSSGTSACVVDFAAVQMASSRVEPEGAPTAGEASTDPFDSSDVSFKTPYLPNKPIAPGINKDAGFKKPCSKTDSVHVFNNPVIVPEQSESDVVSQHSADSGAELPTAVNMSPVSTSPEGPRSTFAPVYTPPDWIGTPPHRYWLETLRNGVILDSLELTDFSQVTFGRLPECCVTLQHPSVSRHHAVLVYRARSDKSRTSGYYLYDLKSTHGTFLNKRQLLANTYCPVRVGHMFRFGGSSRLFILQGPEGDEEPEGDLSVTELRQLAVDKKLQKIEKSSDLISLPAGSTADDDSQGITWGMGEDACEATDLQYNPYALGEGDSQHLYLDDPKKTLRGWFEREGFDMEYITEDLTNGRHVCRVELPLNAVDGRPVFAEVNHVGRKRDAVVQCALEACRLLDRAGLLRQAKHEARGKRVRRPGFDSDDEDLDNDTFLDRTGSVEQKRQRKLLSDADKSQPQTYESLLESYTAVHDEAEQLQRQLDTLQTVASVTSAAAGDADELDNFMSSLSSRGPAALQERRRVKVKLTGLRSEESRLRKLVNLTRPATLPPLLVPPTASSTRSLQPSREAAASTPAFKQSSVIVGKRKGGAGSVRKLPVVSAKSTVQPADIGSSSPAAVTPPQSAVESPTTTTSFTSIASTSTTSTSTKSTTPSSTSTTSFSTSTTSSSTSTTSSSTSTTSSSTSTTSTTSSYTSTSRSNRIESRVQVDTDLATAQGYEDKSSALPAEDADGLSQRDHPGKSSKRRRRRDRQKHVGNITECVDSDTYSGWMPPSGQTGDGRTTLNDKLGY